MYVSDYGYATSPSNWNTDLLDYDESTIIENNWMYMGLFEWTISRILDDAYGTFIVHGNGGVGIGYVYNFDGVRPSFSLNSDVEISGGTGTSSNPFTLVV